MAQQLWGHEGHGDHVPVPAPGEARLALAIVSCSSPAAWHRPLGTSLLYLSTGLFQLLIWSPWTVVSSCPHFTFTGSVLGPPGTHRPQHMLLPSTMPRVFHRGSLVTQEVVGCWCISSQLGLSLGFSLRSKPQSWWLWTLF